MTPKKFEGIGNKLIKHKKLLWLVVLVCVITIAALLFAASEFDFSGMPFGVIGFPIIVLFFTWGLLLTIYWFSLEGKMNPAKIASYTGIKKSLNVFFSWYGAIFLSLWYVIVMFVFPWFFLSIGANGQ